MVLLASEQASLVRLRGREYRTCMFTVTLVLTAIRPNNIRTRQAHPTRHKREVSYLVECHQPQTPRARQQNEATCCPPPPLAKLLLPSTTITLLLRVLFRVLLHESLARGARPNRPPDDTTRARESATRTHQRSLAPEEEKKEQATRNAAPALLSSSTALAAPREDHSTAETTEQTILPVRSCGLVVLPV